MAIHVLSLADLQFACRCAAHPVYMHEKPPRVHARPLLGERDGLVLWRAGMPALGRLVLAQPKSGRMVEFALPNHVRLDASWHYWVRGQQDDLLVLAVQGAQLVRFFLHDGEDLLAQADTFLCGECPPMLREVLNAPPVGAGSSLLASKEYGPCACLGRIAGDPYCPCEMRRRGLVPSDSWTPEKKAELTAVLGVMFGWEAKNAAPRP